MKVAFTIEHTVTFRVCYYEELEGGMHYEEFGPECVTIEAALQQLELAQSQRHTEDWFIKCLTTTLIKTGK